MWNLRNNCSNNNSNNNHSHYQRSYNNRSHNSNSLLVLDQVFSRWAINKLELSNHHAGKTLSKTLKMLKFKFKMKWTSKIINSEGKKILTMIKKSKSKSSLKDQMIKMEIKIHKRTKKKKQRMRITKWKCHQNIMAALILRMLRLKIKLLVMMVRSKGLI